MSPEAFRDAIQCSGRARNLLATAITAAVKVEFTLRLDASQARDLARSHTVQTALDSIRTKLRVHENVGDHVRVGLAVVEATIEGNAGTATGPDTDAIREIRKKALALNGEAAGHRQQDWLATQERLIRLRDDITTWSDQSRVFFRGVQKLYRLRRQQLVDLHLPDEILTEAIRDLDGLFVEGVERLSHNF